MIIKIGKQSSSPACRVALVWARMTSRSSLCINRAAYTRKLVCFLCRGAGTAHAQKQNLIFNTRLMSGGLSSSGIILQGQPKFCEVVKEKHSYGHGARQHTTDLLTLNLLVWMTSVILLDDLWSCSRICIQGQTWGLAHKAGYKSAFCNIPVYPGDRHVLGMWWCNHIFVDACLPLGLHSTTNIFNTTTCFYWVSGICYRYRGHGCQTTEREANSAKESCCGLASKEKLY